MKNFTEGGVFFSEVKFKIHFENCMFGIGGTPYFYPEYFFGLPIEFSHISVYNYCVQLYVVFSEYFLFTLLFLINFRKIMLRSLI